MAVKFSPNSVHVARVPVHLGFIDTGQATFYLASSWDAAPVVSSTMPLRGSDNQVDFSLAMPNIEGTFHTFLMIEVNGELIALYEGLAEDDVIITAGPPPADAFAYSNMQVTESPSWQNSVWLTATVRIRVTNNRSVPITHELHIWHTWGGVSQDMAGVGGTYAIWAKSVTLNPGASQTLTFGPGSGEIVFDPGRSDQLWVQDESGHKSPIYTQSH